MHMYNVDSGNLLDLPRLGQLGYWCQRLDDAWQLSPQHNQKPLAVKYKVGRHPSELGVSKSMELECDTFPLVFPILLAGQQEGHPPSSLYKAGCWFVGQ